MKRKKIDKNYSWNFGVTNRIIDRVRVENSPNNRARCKDCRKFITKGSLRMVFWGTFPIYYKTYKHLSDYKYYICWRCGESTLNSSISILQLVRRDYKKWIKNNPEIIKEFKDKNVALEVAGSL